MTIQSQKTNLNYLTDPTFSQVNWLFVLSFARTAKEDFHAIMYQIPE